METECTFGKMEESFMDNGQITIWKDTESISGVMEEGMKVNITTTKRVAMVSIIGLTGGDMKAGGTKESNMV